MSYFLGFQTKQDCPIWQNLTVLDKPLLLKEEKDMARLRRWYKHFYGRNDPNNNSRSVQS